MLADILDRFVKIDDRDGSPLPDWVLSDKADLQQRGGDYLEEWHAGGLAQALPHLLGAAVTYNNASMAGADGEDFEWYEIGGVVIAWHFCYPSGGWRYNSCLLDAWEFS